MIQSFGNKPTEALWQGKEPPELPPVILKTALRKLTQLEATSTLDELRFPPANRLESLRKERIGQHSIRIDDQFQVCFRWDGQDAKDVVITTHR